MSRTDNTPVLISVALVGPDNKVLVTRTEKGELSLPAMQYFNDEESKDPYHDIFYGDIPSEGPIKQWINSTYFRKDKTHFVTYHYKARNCVIPDGEAFKDNLEWVDINDLRIGAISATALERLELQRKPAPIDENVVMPVTATVVITALPNLCLVQEEGDILTLPYVNCLPWEQPLMKLSRFIFAQVGITELVVATELVTPFPGDINGGLLVSYVCGVRETQPLVTNPPKGYRWVPLKGTPLDPVSMTVLDKLGYLR